MICCCCGQPLTVEPHRANGRTLFMVTCDNRYCHLQSYTLDMARYPTMDLTAYYETERESWRVKPAGEAR